MDAKLTGQFIRRKRKELGLSQLELSKLVYVEPQAVSKWERGLSMPDYDKLDSLKAVFNCTLSDILEPEPIEDDLDAIKGKDNIISDNATNYQMVAKILDDKNSLVDTTSKENSKLKFSDLFSRKRIGKKVANSFGYQYEDVYNEKFLFKGIFKKRTKHDYETTFTQGMFKDNINRTVLGISAPWLYVRAFLLLAICTILALCLTFLTQNPILYIVFGGLCAVVPLTLFLFESNFSRDISILQVMKLFLLGGLSSLLLLLIIEPIGDANEIVSAVVVAPIFEEIAKFTIAVIAVSIIKPKNMLSGLLIGFAIGGGFDVFETYQYGIIEFVNTLLREQDVALGVAASVLNIFDRTFSAFFSGHHYFTGIATAVYVLFKKDTRFHIKDVFSWKTMCALLVSMLLHATWNGACFLNNVVCAILHVLVNIICVTAFIILINIGIAQHKVISIYENAMDDLDESENVNSEPFKDEPIIE